MSLSKLGSNNLPLLFWIISMFSSNILNTLSIETRDCCIFVLDFIILIHGVINIFVYCWNTINSPILISPLIIFNPPNPYIKIIIKFASTLDIAILE